VGKTDQADFCHGDHLHPLWPHRSYQDVNRAELLVCTP
jgi:hypothetical protein